MTSRMIENRVRKIRTLEQRKDKLDEQIEKAKGELIAEMARKKTDILTTDNGTTARYQQVVTNRIDQGRFKTALPDVYKQFLVPKSSNRFTYKLMED